MPGTFHVSYKNALGSKKNLDREGGREKSLKNRRDAARYMTDELQLVSRSQRGVLFHTPRVQTFRQFSL